MKMKWPLVALFGLSLSVSHCGVKDRDFSAFGDGDGDMGGDSGDGDGDVGGDGDGDAGSGGVSGDGDGDLGGEGGEPNGSGGDIIVPVDCVVDDCPSTAPFCDEMSQTCRGCEADDECLDLDPGTPHCVEATCVACIQDDECPTGSPVCGEDGSCRGCESDDECGSMACSSDGTCVPEDTAIYVLAQTGLSGTCGTKEAPCAHLDDGAALLSTTRPNLIFIPTPQSFTNYNLVLPAGVDVTIYGNDVRINSSSTPIVAVNNGTVTMHDMRIEGFDNAMQTQVSCANGSVTLRDSHFSHAGTAIDASDCAVDVSTSAFESLGYGISSYCNADPCMPGFQVERSRFSDIPDGAMGTYSEGGRIVNNIFSNIGVQNYARGVEVRGASTYIGFNTFYRSGSCLFTGLLSCIASDLVVTSNLSFESTENSTDGPCYDQVYYSCDDVNYAFSEVPIPGGTGNQWGDPMLVDPANGDFHLMSGSDAIDAGDPGNAPTVDFYGNPRTVGDAADVGAIEFQ